MSTYKRTTRDEWRLLVNYGQGDGWEHETTEETRKAGLAQLKTYRENVPEYPTKLVKARVKIVPCRWFLKCANESETTRPHPILGDVPICERCNAVAGRLGA